MHDRRGRGQGREVEAHVYQRLSLTRLALQVREVLAIDALPFLYALKLAPLDAATQAEALERCFRPLGGDAKYSREWLEPIGRLQEWLAQHARLDPRSENAKVLLSELATQVEETERTQAAMLANNVNIREVLMQIEAEAGTTRTAFS